MVRVGAVGVLADPHMRKDDFHQRALEPVEEASTFVDPLLQVELVSERLSYGLRGCRVTPLGQPLQGLNLGQRKVERRLTPLALRQPMRTPCRATVE
jgi:hypothetical protein